MTDDNFQTKIEEPSWASIKTENDGARLARWYREHIELSHVIEERVKAQRAGMGELVDHSWMRRACGKIANLRITARRIEERMHELGIMPPYPPTDPRKREITRLNERCRSLKNLLAEHGIAIPTFGEAKPA